MNSLAVAIVFRERVPKQTKIKKIGRYRLELERRLVAFVQRAGVGPNPADTMFFEQMNNRTLVPARVTECDRESKIVWQLSKEFAQALLSILRRIGRRQLNENHRQFRRERLERVEKSEQLRITIVQPPLVRDLPRQFAGE